TTFSTASLTTGSHSVFASYGGDANFGPSTSAPFSKAIGKSGTKAMVALAPATTVYGQPVTFTATITAIAPCSGVPPGSVTFKDATTVLGSGSVDGTGHATFSTSGLAPGGHAINATYNGDSNFAASAQSLAVGNTVNRDPSTILLVASPGPAVFGQTIT